MSLGEFESNYLKISLISLAMFVCPYSRLNISRIAERVLMKCILRICRHILNLLKMDSKNGRFIWITCVIACGSDLLGTPQPAKQTFGESFVMTLSLSDILYAPHPQRGQCPRIYSNVTGAVCKSKIRNSGKNVISFYVHSCTFSLVSLLSWLLAFTVIWCT